MESCMKIQAFVNIIKYLSSLNLFACDCRIVKINLHLGRIIIRLSNKHRDEPQKAILRQG